MPTRVRNRAVRLPFCFRLRKSSEKHQCRQQNRREQKNKTRYAAEKGKTDYSECDGKHEHVPRKSVKPVTVFHSFTRFRRSESFLS